MSLPTFSTWLRFRVRTFNEQALDRAAAQLAERTRDLQPDLIIGIRSGGYVVAEKMAGHFSVPLLPITCRRVSTETKQKSSTLKALLRRLPHAINDKLRIVEHIILTQLRAPKPAQLIPDASETAAIDAFLRQHPQAKLLVVDDAVDSGSTLKAVTEQLRSLAPHARISIAAITVTTTSPLIQPDVFLYRYVLCRFPWSLDFKQ